MRSLSAWSSENCIFLTAVVFALTSCSKNDDRVAGNSPTGIDGGRLGCSSPCDDGISCTIDVCVSGECRHSIGPNSGKTKCPAGKFCTVEDGCTAAPACAADEGCEEAFESDACKDNPRCDPASSVCQFDLLDKDGDGHAPQICGGDDCDDDNRQVYPEAPDDCDGVDNDCDGEVDEEASCSDMHECVDGACECSPEYLCGSSCVNTQTAPDHCGECNHSCAIGGGCEGGACSCPQGFETCDDACTDLAIDHLNCGECGRVCPPTGLCVGGECQCAEGLVQCTDECVDLSTNIEHCGGCDNTCHLAASCEKGICVCEPGPCPEVLVTGDRIGNLAAADGSLWWTELLADEVRRCDLPDCTTTAVELQVPKAATPGVRVGGNGVLISAGTQARDSAYWCPSGGCGDSPTAVLSRIDFLKDTFVMGAQLYWTEGLSGTDGGSFVRSCLLQDCPGTSETLVSVDGVFGAWDVVVVEDRLFWTSEPTNANGLGRIEECTLPCTGESTLTSTSEGTFLGLSAFENTLYWTEGNSLMTCFPDDCTTTIEAIGASDVRDFLVDEGQVFWLEDTSVMTCSSAQCGETATLLAHRNPAPGDFLSFVALAVDQDFVYWATGDGVIERVPRP